MSKETSIRVVIRKPFHPMLRELSEQLKMDDLGEVVNYVLLEFQRRGSNLSESPGKTKPNPEKSLALDLAGML